MLTTVIPERHQETLRISLRVETHGEEGLTLDCPGRTLKMDANGWHFKLRMSEWGRTVVFRIPQSVHGTSYKITRATMRSPDEEVARPLPLHGKHFVLESAI